MSDPTSKRKLATKLPIVAALVVGAVWVNWSSLRGLFGLNQDPSASTSTFDVPTDDLDLPPEEDDFSPMLTATFAPFNAAEIPPSPFLDTSSFLATPEPVEPVQVSPPISQPVAKPIALPAVTMILTAKGMARAMVDGDLVTIGDRVGGTTVDAIEAGGVHLKTDSGAAVFAPLQTLQASEAANPGIAGQEPADPNEPPDPDLEEPAPLPPQTESQKP